MKILLYNSLTNKKEIFQPLDQSSTKPVVKMYSCGPTVYDFAHIGNFRSFLFADLVHRLLTVVGYHVKFVMNITDIDDKTILASQKKKVTLNSYTEKYTQAFFKDIKRLNCLPATGYPLATSHISEMIVMIKKLLKTKHAYFSDGSVYFKIDSFPEYGKLTNIKLSKQKHAASQRIQLDEYTKSDLSDFVLWKKYSPTDREVYWEDEILGKGRPGWHIECSAMSKKILGKQIDIHTGGIDNKFPHHENEIAQSTCCNESNYVNYWLHCSHLLVEGKKMSKSLGNFYTLRDLLQAPHAYNPLAIRYLLLSAHYRTHLNFTLSGITAAEKSISRINHLLQTLLMAKKNKEKQNSQPPKEDFFIDYINKKKEKFLNHLSNDLNVSAALGTVFELVNKINKEDLTKLTFSQIDTILFFFKTVNQIFATFNLKPIANNQLSNVSVKEQKDTIPVTIKNLVEQRKEAKAKKNFLLADKIRAQINDLGYQITDTSRGVQLEKK